MFSAGDAEKKQQLPPINIGRVRRNRAIAARRRVIRAVTDVPVGALEKAAGRINPNR
jgi:hypothetical protein